MSQLTNKEVFDAAILYLLSFPSITETILEEQITFDEKQRPPDKASLFKALLSHATNRQGMPKTIGSVDLLKECLMQFDAAAVEKEYHDWACLFDAIQSIRRPTSRMDKGNPHSYWVVFSKTILSVAQFVNRFKSIEEFDGYVKEFLGSGVPDVRLGLPLIMKEELFGYDFALACDFLKEHVSSEFVKPDVHIKEIFEGIGRSRSTDSDFQVFREVVKFAQSINEVPYRVDKLFWLIGSGKFYRAGIQISADRDMFIRQIRDGNAGA